MHHLVGTREIAAMLGVSRQYVHRLTQRDDFPKPVAIIGAGSIWERQAIEKWLEGQEQQHDPS